MIDYLVVFVIILILLFIKPSTFDLIKARSAKLVKSCMSIKCVRIRQTFDNQGTNVAHAVSSEIVHFDFLDGFRGLCAFIVIVIHSLGASPQIDYKNTLIQHMCINGTLTQAIAMPGFFLLSSFLLTYRLMSELLLVDSIFLDSSKLIVKYFIRRFFRIYLPFVIFCACIKYSPKKWGKILIYDDIPIFSELVWLSFNIGGNNHLWTIPLEINYYFFIPFICMSYLLIYRLSRKVLYVILFACIYLSIKHFQHNMLSYMPKNPFINNLNDMRAPTFSTFLCGSLLAFTYLTFENLCSNTCLFKWVISSRLFQILLNLPTISLIIYGFRSEYLQDHKGGDGRYLYWYKGAYFWSITIFVLLLSQNEYNLGRMFFNMSLMKKFGIYSYGIYLWHPVAIKLTERINLEYKLIRFKNPYEYFGVICVLSFLFGLVFYYLIEKNMIRIASYLCKRSCLKSSKRNNNLSLLVSAQPTKE